MRAFPERRPARSGPPRPAVFLDRDGVLVHNREGYYLTDPADMRIYPFAARAVRALADAGFRVIVLTNQSGVERGYMSLRTAVEINRRLVRELRRLGAGVDAVYFCPHAPETRCACRKPAPGLLREASRDFRLLRRRSWMIGDKFSDLALAKAGKLRPLFVMTGQGPAQIRGNGALPSDTPAARDLLSAVSLIKGLGPEGGRK